MFYAFNCNVSSKKKKSCSSKGSLYQGLEKAFIVARNMYESRELLWQPVGIWILADCDPLIPSNMDGNKSKFNEKSTLKSLVWTTSPALLLRVTKPPWTAIRSPCAWELVLHDNEKKKKSRYFHNYRRYSISIFVVSMSSFFRRVALWNILLIWTCSIPSNINILILYSFVYTRMCIQPIACSKSSH